MRILFAGNPEFARIVLQILYQFQSNFKITAVLTNPDRPSSRGLKIIYSPVKQFAIDHNIKIFQPNKLSDQDFQNQLFNFADILVVCAYGKIIPPELLNFSHPSINVHASILPRWRGAAPIERAIMAGDKKTGISIMKISEGLDQGDVYLSKSTEIEISENAKELSQKLAKIGGDTLVEVLSDLNLEPGIRKYQPRSQQELAKTTPITYAEKVSTKDGEILFTETPINIYNKTRALSHLFGAFYHSHHQQKIIIRKSQVVENLKIDQKFKPGQIIAIENDGVTISCNQGAIKLNMIQRVGKKTLRAVDVINGMRLQPGDLL